MELAYHRKCITDAYNAARFAQRRQRLLDRNTISIFAGFIDDALGHEGFDKTPEMGKIKELAAILREHYSIQRKEYTFSMIH